MDEPVRCPVCGGPIKMVPVLDRATFEARQNRDHRILWPGTDVDHIVGSPACLINKLTISLMKRGGADV